MKLTKISILLTAGFAACVVAGTASANLYISPVNKESSSVNFAKNVISAPITGQQVVTAQQQPVLYQQTPQGLVQIPVVQGVTPTGQVFAAAMQQDDMYAQSQQHFATPQKRDGNVGLTMSVYNQTPTVLMNQGKDIPLVLAVENIVPDYTSWTVNYDRGIHSMDVSWSGGDTWEGVLHSLSQQNELYSEINAAERVIGIAKKAEIAKHLAKKIPTVWHLDTGKSLRENIQEWCDKAGWSLSWKVKDGNKVVDYWPESSTTLTGDFVGEGGVIDQVLRATSSSEMPLSGIFKTRNNTLIVERGGFEQQLSF